MKILIVSQYFWPENFRVNDLATALLDRGHEVTVLTGWPNYPEGKIYEDFKKSPQKYSKLNGVNIIRIPLAPRGQSSLRLAINYLSFVLSASLLGSVKLSGKKFDIIFVSAVSPITVAIPAIFFKFLKRSPVILWVLDLWPETLSAVGAVKSQRVLNAVGVLVKFIYKNCDLILAQSRSFIDGINRYCRERQKIKYFPSWSEDLIHQTSTEIAPELEEKRDVFNVLFSGNVGDAQDFPTILTAAEHLKERTDIRWIIVGDGRMADWVKAQIEKRGLEKHVVMTGRYPLERMPSFFLHADAFLVSLKANAIFAMTIPGKIQTYLSFGLPVIGAIDGEGARVVADAAAGYTCPAGDAQGLSEVVARMAALSTEERQKMGAAAKAYYAAQFEKKMLIDRLEGFFADSVKNVAEDRS